MKFELPHNNIAFPSKETQAKPFLSAAREFSLRVNEQFETSGVEPYTMPDGRIVEVPVGIPVESAKELVEGCKVFWQKAQQAYDSYWETEISKTGNQHFKGNKLLSNEVLSQFDVKEGKAVRRFEYDAKLKMQLAFELFITIQSIKPDRIITLVNGAVRLHAICQALGFDSSNFLSIHRNTGEDYRKDLTKETTYEGQPIEPGSKVLMLEDTSELSEQRTYRDAREWLKKHGVTEAPVFIEYMTSLNEMSVSYGTQKDEDRIKVQNELNQDDCYNSFSNGEPSRGSTFWSNIDSRIVKITKDHPELYDQFFDFIRNYKK